MMTNLLDFEDHVLQGIMSNLEIGDINHTASLVCKRINGIINDNSLWQKVDSKTYNLFYHKERPLNMRQCFTLKKIIFKGLPSDIMIFRIYVEAVKMRNYSLDFDLAAIILFMRSEPKELTFKAYESFMLRHRELFQKAFIQNNNSFQDFQADPLMNVERKNPYDFLSLSPHEIVDQIEAMSVKEE